MALLKAGDTVAGSLARCFITINGKRYNFLNIISFEAIFEKVKSKVPILGKTAKGNKASGWSGIFKGVAHYNTSILRELAEEYKNSGKDVYFEIQVTNEDPTTSIGRQTVVFKECNMDSFVLAKFDADAEYLDEDINGTFEDFEMPEKFSLIEGMI